jgi:hypothetical protein
MFLHVVVGNLIGDALVAQSCQQPIEHGRRVVVPDRCSHLISGKVGSNVVDQVRRTGETANCMDQPNSVVECWRRWFGNFRMISALGRGASSCDRGGHGPQIIATSLRWASLSPSMYRWVVWIDR